MVKVGTTVRAERANTDDRSTWETNSDSLIPVFWLLGCEDRGGFWDCLLSTNLPPKWLRGREKLDIA